MEWSKQIKITEIPKIKYVGYFWISDKNKPQTIENIEEFNKYCDKNGMPTNPFILESNLYNKEEKISINIKHISGKYIVTQYNLKDLKKENFNDKTYLLNSHIGKKIQFKEVWIEEKEETCEQMEVMKKQAIVFVGLEN